MNFGFPIDEFDDGGVSAFVLEGEVDGGVVPVGLDHDRLDVFQQGERLLHGGCLIKGVLEPENRGDALLFWVARAEIGFGQIEEMAAQTFLVHPVHRANPVDTDGQAGVFRIPVERILSHDGLWSAFGAVPVHASGEKPQNRLGAFRPVHRAGHQHPVLVVIPEDPGTGECGGEHTSEDQDGNQDTFHFLGRYLEAVRAFFIIVD